MNICDGMHFPSGVQNNCATAIFCAESLSRIRNAQEARKIVRLWDKPELKPIAESLCVDSVEAIS